jgi:hypothetical protein
MDDRDCLAHYPFVVVRIACRVCSRRGSYRLARLAAKLGTEISLRDLTERFLFDCLWRAEARSERGQSACGVYLPDLEQPRAIAVGLVINSSGCAYANTLMARQNGRRPRERPRLPLVLRTKQRVRLARTAKPIALRRIAGPMFPQSRRRPVNAAASDGEPSE